MFRKNLEVRTGTTRFVSVPVAFSSVHGQRTTRDELIKGDALAVQRDISAFGLGDLQEVAAHARQADRLCRRGTLVGRWHLFQVELVHTKQENGCNKDHSEGTHGPIVSPGRPENKLFAICSAVENNTTENPAPPPLVLLFFF